MIINFIYYIGTLQEICNKISLMCVPFRPSVRNVAKTKGLGLLRGNDKNCSSTQMQMFSAVTKFTMMLY